MTRPLPEDTNIDRVAPVTLAALSLSKRKLGFRLAAAILFVFLLLPMLQSVSSPFDEWQATFPVTLLDSWSTGQLSGGHIALGAKCSACHQRPFRPVSDDACAQCHKQLVPHAGKGSPNASGSKKLPCIDCHQAHKGPAGMVLRDSSRCTTCHGDIKSGNSAAMLAGINDFGKAHPPFRITVQAGTNVVRVRQDDKEKLLEEPRLKFSHKVHLVKAGVSSPDGNIVMACRDCHRMEESGIHFAPMTMRTTCQQSRCHRSYFAEPVSGRIHHGSEREVMSTLREFYVKWLIDTPANMAACQYERGAYKSAKRTFDCANQLARRDADVLFRDSGETLECGKCHQISATGDDGVPWKVTPLHINRDWLPGAVFPHVRHKNVECLDCHDKSGSKASAEIAMPAIEKCRECHAGDRPGKEKIKSSCDSCHRYHYGV